MVVQWHTLLERRTSDVENIIHHPTIISLQLSIMMHIIQTSKDSQIQLQLHHIRQNTWPRHLLRHTHGDFTRLHTDKDWHAWLAARGRAIRSRDRIAVSHRERDNYGRCLGLGLDLCGLVNITVHIPNDISFGSAVFAGFKIVTDRPTDRQTMVLRL